MNTSAFLPSLVENGLADETEIRTLLRSSGGDNLTIAKQLFETLELTKDRNLLAKLYSDSIGKAHVPLGKTLFQREALALLPAEIAKKLLCIPVYKMGDTLTVAMAHPEDTAVIASLEKLVGCPVSTVFAFPQEIENSIDIQYETTDELEKLSDQLAAGSRAPEKMDTAQLKELASSTGVVELVRGMLLYCLQNNASDIHIQPTAKTLNARFRIDGQLRTVLQLNKNVTPTVMSRLKIMASLDITEQRHPQDGRLSLELKNSTYDFRLSTVPTVFGEKAVIRVIGSADQVGKPIDQLSLSTRNQGLLTHLIKKPNGVFFVTGPTGSGKTTTLYSVLSKINRPEINVITVEDPVELRIDGITQIQTNAAIDLDFAEVLRAVLRQDPQVILIGEIRDLETARIAMQAAQTGHLVMATMHTNNALQAINRLIEIGVDPFMVAPSLVGSMAQRLVRRICEHCKEKYEAPKEVIDQLFYNHPPEYQGYFYRGLGCDACNHSGYSGRVAIHEIFIMTDRLRDLVMNRASSVELYKEALRLGFRSMRYDGIMKAMLGITSLEEVERVTAG